MHSKSHNAETMINDAADEVIKELFDSLKNRYQNNLEPMKDSGFGVNEVHLFYYKCHKRNPNCGGSCINSLDWINSSNNKSHQKISAVTVVLNNEKIGKNLERITKIKLFINKYKLERLNFPSEKDDWKKIETNNVMIALSVLHFKNEKNTSCLCF